MAGLLSDLLQSQTSFLEGMSAASELQTKRENISRELKSEEAQGIGSLLGTAGSLYVLKKLSKPSEDQNKKSPQENNPISIPKPSLSSVGTGSAQGGILQSIFSGFSSLFSGLF